MQDSDNNLLAEKQANSYSETSSTTKNPQDQLDDYMKHFGWYQIVIILLTISAKSTTGIQATLPLFSVHKQDFKCDVGNVTGINESLLYEHDDPVCGVENLDFCRINVEYLESVQNKSIYTDPNGGRIGNESVTNRYQDCENFVFDKTGFYEHTFTSEFDIVCGNRVYADWIKSCYYVSVILSVYIHGALADRFGRRPVYIGTGIGLLFATLFSAKAWSPESYVIARMTVAYFMFGYSLVMYTICIEVVGPSARSKANFMYSLIYGLGTFIMSYPLASVWGSNWRTLEMACFWYTAICMLPTIFLIPESFRWQLIKGQPEKARVLIHKIAKKQNEKLYDEKHLDELIIQVCKQKEAENSEEIDAPKKSMLTIFQHPTLTKLTFKMSFMWFVNAFVYYGLTLNAGHLPGTTIQNNAVMGALEVPAYIVMYLLTDWKRMGRRGYMGVGLLVASFCIICSVIAIQLGGDSCEADQSTKKVYELMAQIFVYIGKFCITGTFMVCYIWSAEMFSTDLRNTCIAVCSIVARFGSILAPFVVGFQDIFPGFLGIVFGGFGLVAGIVAFQLPETLGKDLPLTVEDAELRYSMKTKKVRHG